MLARVTRTSLEATTAREEEAEEEEAEEEEEEEEEEVAGKMKVTIDSQNYKRKGERINVEG